MFTLFLQEEKQGSSILVHDGSLRITAIKHSGATLCATPFCSFSLKASPGIESRYNKVLPGLPYLIMKATPNSYPLLREAKVISTTDPEKLGRIQLRVYPELAEISPETDLPWCFPHTGGLHGKSFGVPLKDQLITCIVWSRYWNEITFLPFNITKPTEHLFDKWIEEQKPKIADMKEAPEEEHCVVEEYEDGFTIFHDTKNNQHGFLHPKETFVTINKDGDVYMQSIKKLTFHNKNSDLILEADSETGDITFKTKGKIDSIVDGDVTQSHKANWKMNITGNTEIKTTGNTKIESVGTMGIKSTGPCTVESSAMVVVDAPTMNFKGMKSMGTVPPSGSGVFCAIPICVCSGLPHIG
ncbi:hypothetical protein ACYULU_03425 [Breznakiellaceae bacterium SP9]